MESSNQLGIVACAVILQMARWIKDEMKACRLTKTKVQQQ
jgi:hypothetical protein